MSSTVTGEIGSVGGTLKITRILVRYEVVIPAGTRAAAERALAHHVANCPVAQTLLPCVRIDWEADIREEETDDEA